MISPEDLRSAVRTGLITEVQAAGLMALADQRSQTAGGLAPTEEPFQLFRGFNEIFIVIGLAILFGGWTGVVGLWLADGLPEFYPTLAAIFVTLAGLYGVQRYFTLKRRMVAPSIALSVMTGMILFSLGMLLAIRAGLGLDLIRASGFAVAALGLLLHYRIFRVPFDALLIGGAAFSAIWMWLASRSLVPDDPLAVLHFSSEGLPALLSVSFGVICFLIAMRFDFSDPRRISTRAATGFWLHVLAAPAIINPVAMRLISLGHGGEMALLGVLAFLAVVALVIDRRSFLVSGAAYAVGIVFALFDSPMLLILGLGFSLVFLGAQWDRLRGALLRALPEFPGKDRLPPYGQRI